MSQPASRPNERLRRREIPALPDPVRLRSIPAWALSCLIHVCILVAASLLWTATPHGTGSDVDRPVGVAVVYETAAGEAYFLSESSGQGSGEEASAAELAEQLPSSSSLADSQAALLADLLPGSASAGGATQTAAGGLGLSGGGGSVGTGGKIPKAKTTVFGIEGEGTRFLYVFDRSDSMNGYGGAPLAAAKRELSASLESLSEVHQFQIIFYNDSPLPLGGLGGRGPQLFHGTVPSKQNAVRFVRDISAIGGTQHIDALLMALAMSPDVVFFLTDADHPAPSARDLDKLTTAAARAGATLHTIQFGAGPSRNEGGWIRRLAQETLGQYRYIDVTSLSTP